MRITVAICTWNRALLLGKTLERMKAIELPEGISWELLVVNNCCTDDTDEVLARYRDELPLRRLYEPKPGQSNARNCAIHEASGDLLVWTDDDVLVSPDWLAAYATAAREFPDFSVFGGRVDPMWEKEPPAWIHRHLQRLTSTFALRKLDDGTREFPQGMIPIGANMAMRKDVYSVHRFDPRLGNAGNNNLRGDDAEYLRRLESEGMRFLWVSAAAVQHFVPAARLTQSYVWDWFHGSGRSSVLRNQGLSLTTTSRVPRWLYRKYWQNRVLCMLLSLGKGERWFEAFYQAASAAGMIEEWRAGNQVSPAVLPKALGERHQPAMEKAK